MLPWDETKWYFFGSWICMKYLNSILNNILKTFKKIIQKCSKYCQLLCRDRGEKKHANWKLHIASLSILRTRKKKIGSFQGAHDILLEWHLKLYWNAAFYTAIFIF